MEQSVSMHRVQNTCVKELEDISEMLYKYRKALLEGKAVFIYQNGERFAKCPLALLRATSTTAEQALFHGREFHCPLNMGRKAFVDGINHLRNMCTTPKAPGLAAYGAIYPDLSLLAAARALGVGKYTNRVHRFHWAAIVNMPQPEYGIISEVLDALAVTDDARKDPFFRCTSKRLAYLRRENMIDDLVTFQLFLAANPELEDEMSAQD